MFRKFIVTRIVKESESIKSFYFEREDGLHLDDYKPGQFISVRVPLNEGTITRNYTLSDSPERSYYRLTIKRELSGKSSHFFHTQVQEGSVLEISKPIGSFHLTSSALPVVLLSGGVGITPMLSMLEYITERQPERTVDFLHSSINSAVQPMAERLKELGRLNSNLTLSIFHTDTQGEMKGVDFDHKGFITQAHLEKSIRDRADYFLCGPIPFMKSMYTYLKDLGVATEAIHYEFFGEGASLEGVTAPTVSTQNEVNVSFAASNKTATWDSKFSSILELAENIGLHPENSCRMGTCASCETTLLNGEIGYDPEPFLEAQEGNIFICCSQPVSDIKIDL